MPLPYLAGDLDLPPPAPLYFRYDHLEARSECGRHCHPWGQLGLINLGLMELEFASQRLTAPADYLVWIPAHIPHASYVRQALEYTSIYVSTEQAERLPADPCLIAQSPLIRALFEDFCQRRVGAMVDVWDVRQAELLVEHLVRAGRQASYLPDSEDRLLMPILQTIRLDPADARTLAQWAQHVHTTERTLARRFQAELGMSFVQWRNRARFLKALAWLKEGWPVQDIAGRLSYGTPSAFIAMFRKQVGFSPERYRRQMGGE
ncbi:AraC family transcriptional regulator [Chitinimonas sp. BJB300]|uniref:AraC family transcriptional regulator n=1 Tax=Chitinimonas sp. BJB300 TaxID=1559339 RepID=UPI000C11C1A1|nr:helix-turn-helix transcriptional regulator [Chitinimonas sp. BJB300]PHV12824.1 AraC family transcriptional regulator [Chitinimonas sp. BJB300]TSJ88050.1 AraC family transcriptional regulator [Chitinimonas sp. BJB300]